MRKRHFKHLLINAARVVKRLLEELFPVLELELIGNVFEFRNSYSQRDWTPDHHQDHQDSKRWGRCDPHRADAPHMSV